MPERVGKVPGTERSGTGRDGTGLFIHYRVCRRCHLSHGGLSQGLRLCAWFHTHRCSGGGKLDGNVVVCNRVSYKKTEGDDDLRQNDQTPVASYVRCRVVLGNSL
jgi:hypothetical protein